MKITANGEKLLVGYADGYLKLMSSICGEVIKDFGKIHESAISGIVITVNQKFFFTCSC
jgi:hypothetical protein